MPTRTVTTKFYEFDQNNSGGSFDIDDANGIGPRVYIEALNAEQAMSRAEEIGIYFDGCETGRDCSCCGDRWSRLWRDEGVDEVETDQYTFSWHSTAYVHNLDGTITRLNKPETDK